MDPVWADDDVNGHWFHDEEVNLAKTVIHIHLLSGNEETSQSCVKIFPTDNNDHHGPKETRK